MDLFPAADSESRPMDSDGMLFGVSLVLLEEDRLPSYEPYFRLFVRSGLRRVWYVRDTTDPSAEWSLSLRHSAWAREPLASALPSCEHHQRRMGYGPAQLICLNPAYTLDFI